LTELTLKVLFSHLKKIQSMAETNDQNQPAS